MDEVNDSLKSNQEFDILPANLLTYVASLYVDPKVLLPLLDKIFQKKRRSKFGAYIYLLVYLYVRIMCFEVFVVFY